MSLDAPAGRPRLSVFIATSLDGYIATPEGGLGWLEGAAREGEDYGYDAFMSGVDAMAMGRGTYDHIASLEPLPFGGRPVFVFTHRPPGPRPGVTFWQEGPAGAVAAWSGMGLAHVYVDGGRLISDFLAAGFIDDMTLTTVPVLLGDGLPLFHPGPRHGTFGLADLRSWPSGLVSRTYTRVPSPDQGH